MQQQDAVKLANDNNKFFCEIHSDCQWLSILLGENQTRKSRMLCAKCMIDIYNNQKIEQKLVYLEDFMNNPDSSLLKAIRLNDSENNIDENLALLEIERLLIKLEESIKNQLIIIRQNIEQMREYNLRLHDIVNQFELLRSLDCYQGTKELAKLEEQLNQISSDLIKTHIAAKEKVKDNQLSIVNNFPKYFKLIQKEVELAEKKSFEILNQIFTYGLPQIIFDEIYQFPEIHYQISDGKQIKYQLLYQGTRDGLNCQTYWNKCNLQSYLLTIMTTKNGNKFGGYSPGIIDSGLNNYVQDPTLKSFLFQYNKKEIYKLKYSTHAIYCNQGYGPTFGGGYDICIYPNFNDGTSLLGHSYDKSSYNIVDKENYIFGGAKPQMIECKVYKVIFLCYNKIKFYQVDSKSNFSQQIQINERQTSINIFILASIILQYNSNIIRLQQKIKNFTACFLQYSQNQTNSQQNKEWSFRRTQQMTFFIFVVFFNSFTLFQ